MPKKEAKNIKWLISSLFLCAFAKKPLNKALFL